jgi:hypothetical protein
VSGLSLVIPASSGQASGARAGIQNLDPGLRRGDSFALTNRSELLATSINSPGSNRCDFLALVEHGVLLPSFLPPGIITLRPRRACLPFAYGSGSGREETNCLSSLVMAPRPPPHRNVVASNSRNHLPSDLQQFDAELCWSSLEHESCQTNMGSRAISIVEEGQQVEAARMLRQANEERGDDVR